MTAAKTQVLDQIDAQLRAINEQLDVLREFNRKVDRLEQTGFWRRYENLTPNVVMKMNDMKFEPTGATSFAMMGRVESWLEEFDQDEIRINLRAGPFYSPLRCSSTVADCALPICRARRGRPRRATTIRCRS